MAWHCHLFKLAVAGVDDVVRIYTTRTDASTPPVLKSQKQTQITCMAWRPLCSFELVVGCRQGLCFWVIDNNLHLGRTVNPSHVFKQCVSVASYSGNSLINSYSFQSRKYAHHFVAMEQRWHSAGHCLNWRSRHTHLAAGQWHDAATETSGTAWLAAQVVARKRVDLCQHRRSRVSHLEVPQSMDHRSLGLQ